VACGRQQDVFFSLLRQEEVPTPTATPEEAPPPPPARLQALAEQVQELLARYSGQVAFVALDAASGQGVAFNADQPFIAASVIKLFTMMAVLQDVEQGLYTLEEVREDLDLLMLYSDNAANARLTHRAGLGRINQLMQALGLTGSVYSRWPEVEEVYGGAGENYITAGDVAAALLALYRGQVFADPRTTELAVAEMQPALEHDQLILVRYLPPGVRVAHKTGTIAPDEEYPSVLHDVGIVFPLAGNPYVVVFLSQGNADHAAAYDLGAKLSLLAYQAFATP